MRLDGGMPAIELMVNGRGPFLFAFDTGAEGGPRLDSSLMEKLGLKPSGQLRDGDPSGRSPGMAETVKLDSIEVGGIRFTDLTATVRNYKNSPRPLAADAGLDAIVPAALWKDCRLQTIPEPSAIQTAVCLPASRVPDRWEISSYPSGAALNAAYEREVRNHPATRRNEGKCNAFSWGGEREWLHGPDKPGGRILCYFDGNDAVAIWTHARLGQPTHRDVLMSAREGGSDHAALTRWWRPWHHLIGKAQ
jgi:hypothetical protein